MPNPFLTLKNLVAGLVEMNDRVRLVRLQETYALAATAFLLTSVIRVSLLHLERYGLNKWQIGQCRSNRGPGVTGATLCAVAP